MIVAINQYVILFVGKQKIMKNITVVLVFVTNAIVVYVVHAQIAKNAVNVVNVVNAANVAHAANVVN